jgi:hypothetical protein
MAGPARDRNSRVGPLDIQRIRCTYMSTVRKQPVRDTVKFNMRIDRKLKAEADKAAAEDNRSLAGLIVKLLRDHLKRRQS